MRKCNFSLSNLNQSRFQTVRWEESDFTNAEISECQFKQVELSRIKLDQASLFGTLLKGIDLTSCSLHQILLSDTFRELRGATVDMYQAAELATLLGLKVQM